MTSTQPTIASTHRLCTYSERRQCLLWGQLLIMSDGAMWFHPENGDNPWDLGSEPEAHKANSQ